MAKKGINALDKLIERAYDAIGKKLTTKERKKMKKGTFCGPNRSFPIPDCLHVRVAKTYLGRAKFSQATKKRIAACINRKAKALGCTVTKKAKADAELTLFNDPIFESTKPLVEQSIADPGMHLEWDDRKKCYKCDEDKTEEDKPEKTL